MWPTWKLLNAIVAIAALINLPFCSSISERVVALFVVVLSYGGVATSHYHDRIAAFAIGGSTLTALLLKQIYQNV